MIDEQKIANNILDFLIDPTKIPVQQRLYFGPEEKLRNESYEAAKADAKAAYGDQKSNSDFYPSKNRSKTNTQREATIMDRKSLIASFDILSKTFKDDDPISLDLRTMAAAVAKMSDEEVAARVMGAKVKCEKCGKEDCICAGADKESKRKPPEVPICEKCKKPKYFGKCDCTKKKDESDEEEEEATASVEASDFWSKEASDLVAQALVADVVGAASEEEEEEEEEATAAKKPVMKEIEEEEEATASKKPKMDESEEEEATASKAKPKMEEEEEEEEEEATASIQAKKKETKPQGINPQGINPDEKESKIVNTDILANTVTFGDIELEAGMVESGDMTTEEKEKLAKLFD